MNPPGSRASSGIRMRKGPGRLFATTCARNTRVILGISGGCLTRSRPLTSERTCLGTRSSLRLASAAVLGADFTGSLQRSETGLTPSAFLRTVAIFMDVPIARIGIVIRTPGAGPVDCRGRLHDKNSPLHTTSGITYPPRSHPANEVARRIRGDIRRPIPRLVSPVPRRHQMARSQAAGTMPTACAGIEYGAKQSSKPAFPRHNGAPNPWLRLLF
jgi:hypothetical protein